MLTKSTSYVNNSSFVSEDGEQYSVSTLAGITGISRQVYVNSAGRLGTLSDAMGRRLAADVNDRRVAYLEGTANAGPIMRDTFAVFSAQHDNIATLDITSLETIIVSALDARAAASKRKGQGDVMIGQAPTIWLVPPEFEGTALRAVANVAAVEAANVNPRRALAGGERAAFDLDKQVLSGMRASGL